MTVLGLTNGNPNVYASSLRSVDESACTKLFVITDMDVRTSHVQHRLRHETRTEHDAIERTIGLMHPSLSKAQYQRCLTKFYGFYRPIEFALATGLAGPLWSGVMAGRRKTGLLRHDLQCLGVCDPDATPVCAALPILTTPAAAFGCLYVLEGATLGGQIISRHVASRFGYSAEHGAAFFHGYGSQTGAMWRMFGQSLTAFSANSTRENEIVAAALSTFRTLRLWCEKEDIA